MSGRALRWPGTATAHAWHSTGPGKQVPGAHSPVLNALGGEHQEPSHGLVRVAALGLDLYAWSLRAIALAVMGNRSAHCRLPGRLNLRALLALLSSLNRRSVSRVTRGRAAVGTALRPTRRYAGRCFPDPLVGEDYGSL